MIWYIENCCQEPEMTMKFNDKYCCCSTVEGSLLTTLTFFDDFWVMMMVDECDLTIIKFKDQIILDF